MKQANSIRNQFQQHGENRKPLKIDPKSSIKAQIAKKPANGS